MSTYLSYSLHYFATASMTLLNPPWPCYTLHDLQCFSALSWLCLWFSFVVFGMFRSYFLENLHYFSVDPSVLLTYFLCVSHVFLVCFSYVCCVILGCYACFQVLLCLSVRLTATATARVNAFKFILIFSYMLQSDTCYLIVTVTCDHKQ